MSWSPAGRYAVLFNDVGFAEGGGGCNVRSREELEGRLKMSREQSWAVTSCLLPVTSHFSQKLVTVALTF